MPQHSAAAVHSGLSTVWPSSIWSVAGPNRDVLHMQMHTSS